MALNPPGSDSDWLMHDIQIKNLFFSVCACAMGINGLRQLLHHVTRETGGNRRRNRRRLRLCGR